MEILKKIAIDDKNPSPISYQLKNNLQKIIQKNLKEGDKIPSERDIAEHLEIAKVTVSRAILELAHEGLVYRSPGRGTFVSSTSKIETKETPSHIIDVVLPGPRVFDLDYPPLDRFIFSTLLRGISDAAEMNSAEIKMKFIPHKKDKNINCFWENKSFSPAREGIILMQGPEWLAENLSNRDIPYTVADLSVINPDFNYVIADQETGAYKAAEHLIRLGNRKIAFLGNIAPSNAHFLTRFSGYTRALIDNGIKPAEKIIKECISYGEAYKCMKDILRLKDIPTAVFALNDTGAIGAMKAIKEAGLRIPEDIAVVGFDDIDEAKEQNPPLTTVRHPFHEIGSESVILLLKILRNEVKTPAKRILKTPFIIRKSSEKRRNSTQVLSQDE